MNTKKFDHEAILKDWLAGMPSHELATKYGCSSNLGCKLAKQYGVSRHASVVKRANSKRAELSNKSRSNSAKMLNDQKRIAEYTKLHSVKETAKKYGHTESTVRRIARKHGWTPAPQFDRDAILKDYLAGYSLASIASKCGCEASYPSALAKRAGKKRSPKHRKNNFSDVK